MAVDPLHPLSEEHLAQINQALDQAQVLQEAINKAGRAGIDLSNQAQQLTNNVDQLLKIKQVYFPGQ